MRMYEIEMSRKKLNTGQEHEVFQNQGPKDVLPAGPKEEAGRVMGTAFVMCVCP